MSHYPASFTYSVGLEVGSSVPSSSFAQGVYLFTYIPALLSELERGGCDTEQMDDFLRGLSDSAEVYGSRWDDEFADDFANLLAWVKGEA